MKIIQICGVVDGKGITKYFNELNIAFTLAGNDVKIYEIPINDECTLTTQSNLTRQTYLFDYNNQEMVDEVLNADIVCINQMIPRNTDEKYKKLFRELIIEKIQKPKKVIFFNDHGKTTMGFSKQCGPWLHDKEFFDSIDKYVLHSNNNSYARALRKLVGDEVFESKFIQMHHPHHFDESAKDKWLPIEEKHKRCTYIGRYHAIKHVEQVIELFKKLKDDYEFEIRGIDRLISYCFVPELFYDVDIELFNKIGPKKECLIRRTKTTFIPTVAWRKENGYDGHDDLIDAPHNNGRLWLFGLYKHPVGMQAMRKSMFGLEFYRLPVAEEHGDNLEYCMHEIVENGTVPIFDTFTMKSIRYLENGKPTDKTMYDMNICLTLDPDMGNLEELKKQMIELMENPQKYYEYRERAWEVLHKHLDPIGVANDLVERIFS